MRDAVVLGAGPAGVGTAYWAARKGLSVTLVERAPAPGGAAGSFEVAGMRVDHGSHRLHPATSPSILGELRALLGDDLQERPRRGRIRVAGRWVSFPLRISNLARALPPTFVARVLVDVALRPFRSGDADSFADVLRVGLGPTLCERFYFPYARKLWGLDPEDISSEQARRRVAAASAGRLVRKVLERSEGSRFLYPRRGFGAIWEELARAAAEAGAELRYGTTATSLTMEGERVLVACEDGSTLDASVALSTLPLPVLASIVSPAAPPNVLDAARRLETRALVLVYLVLDVDRYTPFDAHYLPEPYTRVTRISEPKNYRDGPDPAGVTVLCAEIPCARDEPLWHAGEEELGELVVDALARSGLPAPAPKDVVVRRLASAYPIYRRGFEDAFARVDAWATSLPRVITLGRQGLFAHDNSHHALEMARAAVDALSASGFDGYAWKRARARFNEHVVED